MTKQMKCAKGSFQPLPKQELCTLTSKGYYANQDGQTLAFACAPGSIAPKEGMSKCDLCAKGFYQDKKAQDKCNPCANKIVGSITAAEGADGLDDCLCPKDHFLNQRGGMYPELAVLFLIRIF